MWSKSLGPLSLCNSLAPWIFPFFPSSSNSSKRSTDLANLLPRKNSFSSIRSRSTCRTLFRWIGCQRLTRASTQRMLVLWQRKCGTTGISLCTQTSRRRSLSSCSSLEWNLKRTLGHLLRTLSSRSRYSISSKYPSEWFQLMKLQKRVKSSFWKEIRMWTWTQINGTPYMVSLSDC